MSNKTNLTKLTGGTWELGPMLCDSWVSLDILLCTASILSLCAISIDRWVRCITESRHVETKWDYRGKFYRTGIEWANASPMLEYQSWSSPSVETKSFKLYRRFSAKRDTIMYHLYRSIQICFRTRSWKKIKSSWFRSQYKMSKSKNVKRTVFSNSLFDSTLTNKICKSNGII